MVRFVSHKIFFWASLKLVEKHFYVIDNSLMYSIWQSEGDDLDLTIVSRNFPTRTQDLKIQLCFVYDSSKREDVWLLFWDNARASEAIGHYPKKTSLQLSFLNFGKRFCDVKQEFRRNIFHCPFLSIREDFCPLEDPWNPYEFELQRGK